MRKISGLNNFNSSNYVKIRIDFLTGIPHQFT